MGIFGDVFSKKKLDKGLKTSNTSFVNKLGKALVGRSTIDADVLDELEEILITSDVGVDTSLKIIERIESRVARDKYLKVAELQSILREEIVRLLSDSDTQLATSTPYIMMVVGVNGVGKTTTIAKLAHQFTQSGKSVVLGAADTFRAAAVDQLQIWSDRVGVPMVKQPMGSDPASVVYDAVQSALTQKSDMLIIDTAGRLHNKINLMNELTKMKRVVQKVIPDAPHEVLLVLDGSTGQNAFQQAKQFSEATQITSLAITKLDGTAKGGVVIGISDQLKVPIKYIGLGEGIEDLQQFNPKEFVESLFS